MTDHVTATHPAYPKYSHLLSDGWVPGRKVVGPDFRLKEFNC
jgi:hypothetical protein